VQIKQPRSLSIIPGSDDRQMVEVANDKQEWETRGLAG
jgi:hypothetical protein